MVGNYGLWTTDYRPTTTFPVKSLLITRHLNGKNRTFASFLTKKLIFDEVVLNELKFCEAKFNQKSKITQSKIPQFTH